MDRKYAFSSLAVQFAVGCDFAVLHCMLVSQNGMNWWFFPGIILLYGPLIYILNRWLLRKERDLRTVTLFEIVAAAVMTALCLIADGWCGAGTLVFMLLSVIWITVQGALLAASSPEVKHMVKCLDITVLMLISFSVYSAFLGLEPSSGAVMVMGFVAACLGTALRRGGRTLGIREWLFTAGTFAVIFIIMMLILSVASVYAGRGIIGIWHGITGAFIAIDAALLRILQPLAALLPGVERKAIILQGPDVPDAGGSEVFLEGSLIGMGSILAVLLVLIAVGAVVIVIKLKSIKVRTAKGVKNSRDFTKYEQGATEKKGLLGQLITYFKMKSYLRENKDTAKGLYLYVLRNCRKSDLRKMEGETPREFLMRLYEKAEGLPELREAVGKLMMDTDKAFYSNKGKDILTAYGKIIRRDINKIK